MAADNITLSPIRGRDIAVLSMVVMGDKDETGDASAFALYARGLEHICSTKYEGVPHWGKKNWANKTSLLPFYGEDAFQEFNDVRQTMDPKGLMLNSYLTQRGIGV